MTVSSLRPACPSVCAYRHCVMVPLPVASVRRVRISLMMAGALLTRAGYSQAGLALLSPREITRSLTVRLSPLPPHRTKTASTPGRWASAISTTRARPAATATRWRFQAVRVAAEKVKTVT